MTVQRLKQSFSPSRLASYENVLLAVLCVSFGALFWNRLALNYVLPFVIQDMKINNAQAGLLVAVLSLSWAVSGFVVGAIADRTGRRKWLLVGLTFAFSLSAVFSGVANGFGALLAARLLMGLAQGPVLPLAQAAMARESSERRRGFNMGVLQNLGSGLLANIIAPIVVVALAVSWGWRSALIASALPGFVLCVVLVFTMRPDDPPPQKTSAVADKRYLSEPNVWLCLGATCALVMWLMVQMTFLPGFMMDQLQFSSGEMAAQMSIRGVSGLIAGISLPALSDRVGRKPVIIIGSVCAAMSPFWVAMPDQTFTTMMLSGLVMGVGAGCLPLVMAIVPSESVPPVVAAATMGLIMGVGELVGGFGAPVSAGIVADHFGSAAPFIMAGGAALAAAALGLGIRETGGRLLQPVGA